MNRIALAVLAAVAAGPITVVACGPIPEGEPPTTLPAPNVTRRSSGPGGDGGVAPGSLAHREALEERTRADFDRRAKAWREAGRSEDYIAYMRRNGLERMIADIRTQPAEWFTMDALRRRIRAKEERAARIFLDAGYPPRRGRPPS